MDAEILQGFIRQAEEYLPAIRGGILVCARAGSIYGELDTALRQIDAIKNAASIIDLTEIVKICREFEETLEIAPEPKKLLGDERARNLLDKLAELEAAVTELYFNDEVFSENLSGFVEDSFEKFQIGNAKYSGAANDAGEKFEIDDETLEVFALEAGDLLLNLRTKVERLENFPNDREALLEIRRSAHTLKGSAAIVGLERLSGIAHRVEDLLDYMAERQIDCGTEIFNLLLTSIDCFEVLARDEKSPQIEKKILRVYENFDSVLTSLQTRAAPELSLVAGKTPECFLEETAKDSIPSVVVQSRPVVRVSLEKLDDLVKLVGDLTAGHSVFEQSLTEFQQRISRPSRPIVQPKNDSEIEKRENANFHQPPDVVTKSDNSLTNENLRESELPELDDFDEFDCATPKNRSAPVISDFAVDSDFYLLKNNLESLFDNQRRLTEQMRDKLLRLRMISFGSLSGRLQRTVRVACEEEEKSAELRIEGENLEIDTQILDCLIEPLLHLLRNAVAHGVEAPELRRLLGKPERGKISLRVWSEKESVIVTVSDDGRGVSIDALKEKAVKNNFISRDEAESINEAEAFELMFLPGLTTAEKLSQTSGRGVGMNIVKTSIERHQGAVSIESEPRTGTTFTLSVPSALTVTRAVLIKAGARLFACPLNIVRHIGKIPAREIFGATEQVLRLGDENFALSHLNELLGIPLNASIEHERVSVLFLKSMEIQSALAVDKILKTEEIVVNQRESSSPDKSEILGTAICDGSVVPVLDLIYLLKKKAESDRGTANGRSKKADFIDANRFFGDFQSISVMIVDDSSSARRAASDLIRNAGWHPIVAEDGIEALEILQTAPHIPDIILTDAEMPRMDGCEFLTALKQSEKLRRIPVVMLTSRDDDEYRRKAVDAGVSAYFTKPYENGTLLAEIKNLTRRRT